MTSFKFIFGIHNQGEPFGINHSFIKGGRAFLRFAPPGLPDDPLVQSSEDSLNIGIHLFPFDLRVPEGLFILLHV